MRSWLFKQIEEKPRKAKRGEYYFMELTGDFLLCTTEKSSMEHPILRVTEIEEKPKRWWVVYSSWNLSKTMQTIHQGF
jgi:hypothetical protein